MVANKEGLHKGHLGMVGELHGRQADHLLQLVHPLLFISHLSPRNGGGDQEGGFGAESRRAQAALGRRVGIIPSVSIVRARFGLQADEFQKLPGASDVLVIESTEDDKPVRQGADTKTADLAKACAAIHENVVIAGVLRQLIRLLPGLMDREAVLEQQPT